MSNFPQHLVFFSFFFLPAAFVLSQSSCPESRCGNLTIKYPLWLKSSSNSNSADSYCGFPDLGVYCVKNEAILHAGNDTYVVESSTENNISYIFKDRDLLGSPCPRARHNLTLVKDAGFPLFLGGSFSIFFYFNCTVKDGHLPLGYIHLDPCIKNEDGKESFAVLSDRKLKSGKDEALECEDIVESPVKNFWDGRNLNGWFPDALRGGFEMVVNPDMARQCRECEITKKGTCMYEKTGERKYEFKCTNGVERKSGGISRTMKITIGVAAGVGGILLASLIFFVLFKYRGAKKRSVPPKVLSWTNSSEMSLRKDVENSADSMGPPFFRYEELHDATSGFSPSNELGDGGFGTVYKGKLRDGRIVAVKRLYENNFKRVEQFLNEAAILNRLRHPNLVSLYGCTSRHSRELLLVYEFIPNGTVADHLHGSLASRNELTWPLRFRIALETATALAYLHAAEPQIIHRDVKTTNILLDANFHVKVADFGLSRLFPLDVTHVSTAPQGTPGYVDPEYHQCYQLTDKSDVYSFGVVLVELISSMPAVDITRRRNEINLSNLAISKIQSGQLGEIVDPLLGFEDDPEVKRTVEVVAELAFRCLQGEKDMRPSMEDIVEALLGAGNGGVRERDEMKEKKMDEMGLLKAVGAPLSPSSVTYKWSSRVTTPNASQ